MNSKKFGDSQKWDNEPFRRTPFSAFHCIFGVSRGMAVIVAIFLGIFIFAGIATVTYMRLRVYAHGHS